MDSRPHSRGMQEFNNGRWQESSRPASRSTLRSSYNGSLSGSSVFNSQRPPTGRLGTASRLANIGTAAPPKTGSRIGSAISRNFMERPITQQGISGVTTTANGTGYSRQVQDQRYWQGVIQLKMRDLQDEIRRLQTDSQTVAREQSAKRHYDKKVKVVAAELTELQTKLADYNMVMENMSSGGDRNRLDTEGRALRERNENLQISVEELFDEKQKAEERVVLLQKEVDKENEIVMRMIRELPQAEQDEYMELKRGCQELRDLHYNLHYELTALLDEGDQCRKDLSGSQMRQEAVRLLNKIKDTEYKYQRVQEEQASRLTPAQEREKLLNEVRESNADVMGLKKQIKTTVAELKKKKLLRDEAEETLEEGLSGRNVKMVELRRRDAHMEGYLKTYQSLRDEEDLNMKDAEGLLVHCLEHASLSVMDGSDITNTPLSELTDQELNEEYRSLSARLKKAEALEQKMRAEIKTIRKTKSKLRMDYRRVTDLETLRNDHRNEIQALRIKREMIRKKKEPTKNAVIEAERRCHEVQKTLESNDMFLNIKKLNEKIEKLDEEIAEIQDVVKRKQYRTRFDEVQEKTFDTLNNYNDLINEGMPYNF